MASAEPTVRTKPREPIDLSGAHIPGMSLSHADLAGSNFSHANLTEVNFQGSNLRDANFRESNLTEVNFQGSNLRDADLRKSNLTRANLTGTDLRRANLAFASLKDAVLSGAKLGEVDLSNAKLSRALIEGLDLSEVKGLEWTGLLDARFDETTVLPDYLEEEDLFQLLEQAYPRRKWRDEFSGRIKDLLAELAKFGKLAKGSILTELVGLRLFEERQVEDGGKRDE